MNALILFSPFLVIGLITLAYMLGVRRGRRQIAPWPVPPELLTRLAEAEQREAFQQRRADEFFGIISGIEKEADGWRRLYKDNQRMAGAAQTWLLRDLGDALRRGNAFAARLRQHGDQVKDLEVDPQLADLVEECKQVRSVPMAPRLPAVATAPVEGVPTPDPVPAQTD